MAYYGKRIVALIVLVLMVTLTLSGCFVIRKADTDVDELESINTPTDRPLNNDPTPTPTHAPDPTITPRPIDIPVITAAPSTTPVAIDPIDKPKPTFKFAKYSSLTLGISFNVPENWQMTETDSAVIFREPDASALDDTPATLWVSVLNQASNLVKEDAEAQIDMARDSLKAEFPGIELSSRGDNNKMLGELGYYYNYRIPVLTGHPIRGRIYAVAINRMFIQLELRVPARYNEDYMDVFREVRSSAALYTGEE